MVQIYLRYYLLVSKGRRAGGRVPKRGKQEVGGSGTKTRAWDQELTGCQEKRETHSTRGRRVWHDVVAMREQGANGPNTDGVHWVHSEMTQHE